MKRLYLFFILAITLNIQLNAQFWVSSLKLIEKGEYADAEKKIVKALAQHPTDVEENFAMSALLAKRKFSGYDIEKSYGFLIKTSNYFDVITEEKELKKLAKIPIDKNELNKLTDTICRIASEDILQKNELLAYEHFLEVYTLCPDNYKNKVIAARNENAYNFALSLNTVESFQHFINTYPNAVQLNASTAKRDSLAYKSVCQVNKIADYKAFVQNYPGAAQVKEAIRQIHQLAFSQAQSENKASSFKSFVDEYPESDQFKTAYEKYEYLLFQENTTISNWISYRNFIDKYGSNAWVKTAQDSIYAIGLRTEQLEILAYCVQNFKDERRKSALLIYHNLFTQDGEKFTLDMFYAKYTDDFLADIKLNDYKLVDMAAMLNLDAPFTDALFVKYDEYIRMAAPRDKALVALQKMISTDVETKNWTSALSKINNYKSYFNNKNKKLNDLISFINSQIVLP